MSGGDGRGPGNSGLGHNGGQASGNVNGTSGKGGPSSGGGTDPNSGPGWGTTHTPNGDIHNYNPREFGGGNGSNKPGSNGGDHRGNNSGGVNLSMFPEAQASLAMGAPSTLSLFDGLWGFSLLKSTTVQDAIAEAFAKIKPMAAPVAGMLWRGGLWGLVIEAVTPTKIAPDDMSRVRHITTALPADMVTQIPFSQIPTQPAVLADARVTEVVENGVQKIAVVRTPSLPFSIPTVPAKPTQRHGVYTAAVVEGMPDIHINVGTQSPAAPQKPAEGVHEVRDVQTFQKQPFETGAHTYDAIVYFPPEANTDPVYVSVTPVLTEQQVRELQDEFNRRLAEWDARYPADAAERRAYVAGENLNREQENVNQKRAALDQVRNTQEGLLLDNPEQHPVSYTKDDRVTIDILDHVSGRNIKVGPIEIKTREQLDKLLNTGAEAFDPYPNLNPADPSMSDEDYEVALGVSDKVIKEYANLRVRLLARRDEVNNALLALNSAAESRNHADQEKTNADSNRDKAKEENNGKPTDFTTDDKIKGQMGERGWTEQDIKDVVAKGPQGISTDQRRPKNTPPDYLGRNDPATVYGEPGKYVVINDRTREVTQVSGKNEPGWVDDSRIFWGDKE